MTNVQSTVTAPSTGEYAIDPRLSEIRFTTRHLFGAGKVEGGFSDVSGTIVVGDPLTASTVAARAASATFDSGDKKRDAKVMSAKFLDAAGHPHISFESTRLRQEAGVWLLDGQLTARGGSAPISLTVTRLLEEPSGLLISAEGTVDRYAHGITALKGMAARHLQISVQASASRV